MSGIGEEEREEVRQYYENLTPAERRARILLVPAYRDAYNELIEAHRTVDIPAYFWKRWASVLGPVASMLYMRLRQYCYGADVGAGGGVCWPKQDTLGEEIGVRCRERLRAALDALERHGFIERDRQYHLDPRTGRPVRGADRYQVFFEVPLVPEDAAELLIRSVHQLPLELDSLRAGIPPLGSQGLKAGIPPSGPCQSLRAGFPPSGVVRAGIPPLGSQGLKAGIPPPCQTSIRAGIPPAEANVQRSQRSTLSGRETRPNENPSAADFAGELADELGDPRSLKWYRLVADKLPELRIRLVLSETRTAKAEGRLRGPAGAYFTGAIRRVAAELGVTL